MRRAWILVVAAIVGVTALAISLLLGSLEANAQRAASDRLRAHTQDVRVEIQGLLSALQDAETGQRGFLIVNRPEYLAPYEAGRRDAFARLDRLGNITRTSPVRQRQIAELRILVAAKLSELAETIDRARAGDKAGATAIVASGRGKAVMDQVRADLAAIKAEEDHILEEQTLAASRVAQSDQNFTYALQVFGLLVLLGAAGLGLKILRRMGRAREDALVQQLAVIVNSADDAIMSDLGGVITSWNAGAERLYGYAADEAIGKSVKIVLPEDGSHLDPELMGRILAGEHVKLFEAVRRRKDGSLVEIELRLSPIRSAAGQVVGSSGIARDITERRESEAALQAGEARFRAAVDAVQGILWTNNAVGEMEGEQPGWSKLTGQTAEEYQGYGWAQAVHPDDAQPTIDGWNFAVAERRKFEFEHRVRRYDGEWRHCTIRVVPTLDVHGSIVEWVGVHTDITEQREAEARQQFFVTLADRLRDLLDPLDVEDAASELLGRFLGVSRVGYGEISADGAMVSHEACYADGVAPLAGTFPVEAFGRENTAELRRGVTMTYADVTADLRTDDADFAAMETRSAIAVPLIRGGQWRAVFYVNHREVRTWTPDELALVEAVAARTWDARERARAASELREINLALEQRVKSATRDREDALARLHEAQKIETLGQLTGGVAHDFNNLLTPIMGGLDFLSRKLAHDERAQRIAAGAMQSAERAKILVQRLLAFGRRQTLQSRALDVAQLIEGMRDLIERSIGPSVQITVDIAADLPAVEADPNQLELAILNLCVNARDAMEHGGRLTISAAIVGPTDNETEPECVAIRVSDTGKGMDEATLAKATEPFFTTKGVGQGTGLGLSMVYGLAAQSGGRLTLSSVVGEGTIVELVLPIATASAETRPVLEVPVIDHGVGTILLVDDEELVRMSIADGLRELGFTMVEAASAAGALQHLREGRVPDVLVTDHMMPGMTGAALAREVRIKLPALPVLMITGYSNLRQEETRGLEVLAKPFKCGDLAARITEIVKVSKSGNVVRLPAHSLPRAAD